MSLVGKRIVALLVILACVSVASLAAPKPGKRSVSPWSLMHTATLISTGATTPKQAIQITSQVDPSQPYGVTGGEIVYTPAGSIYFQDLYQLSTDWRALTDWGGGSPRFALAIDVDGDGVFTPKYLGGADGWAFAYVLAQFPSFYGGPTGWLNSGNLVGTTTKVWDTTQLGGPGGYEDYASALARLTGKGILGILLVCDSGWLKGWSNTTFVQVAWFNNVTVNADVLGYR